jgi:hypothetical protein
LNSLRENGGDSKGIHPIHFLMTTDVTDAYQDKILAKQVKQLDIPMYQW